MIDPNLSVVQPGRMVRRSGPRLGAHALGSQGVIAGDLRAPRPFRTARQASLRATPIGTMGRLPQ